MLPQPGIGTSRWLIFIDAVSGSYSLAATYSAQLNRAYADWQQKEGLSGQTALHHHRLVHRVLSVAMREGRLRQNVAALTERPRAQRHERRHFSRNEMNES